MAASSKFRLSLHSRRHLRTIIRSFQHQQHTTPSSSPLLRYSSLPVSDDVAAVELPPLSAPLHRRRFVSSTEAPPKLFSSSLGRFSSESLWSRQLHQQAVAVDDLQHRELIPLLPKAKEQEKSIPVKAYFLCTSVDLKSMQTEDGFEVILSSSRSSNYIACRFCDAPPVISCFGVPEDRGCCPHMVVFQYGAVVLFNIADNDVERYLDIVRSMLLVYSLRCVKTIMLSKRGPRWRHGCKLAPTISS